MTEDKFFGLAIEEAESLKTVFSKEHGLLATSDSISIRHTAFEINFIIKIFQHGTREIEVTANIPTRAQNLWAVLYDVIRLSMLFDGEFLQLKSAEFYLNNAITSWSEELVFGYRQRMLSYYSSADFIRGTSKFISALQFLSDELLDKWIQVENELQLVHPMVLYGMSSVKLPAELKTAILIEAFEPLFELIQKNNSGFKMADALPKSNGAKDSKLRRMLESIILEYGADIFEKEIGKDIHSFCQALVNSRNRIFHIKSHTSKLFLDGSESVLYAAKLSMLYRKVLLELLGINYAFYSESLKELACKWNAWNGTLDFFLATRWTD